MASITSNATGLWSAAGTWVGGVAPVLGDKVTIAAGHVVTVDGTYSCGDDTSTGCTILGTLKASRTVSSQITFRGQCLVSTGGTLDYGTQADPIPSSVTAVIVVNDSAAMANNKWGISCSTSSSIAGFRMRGAAKTDWSTISAATSTDTTFTVADATGWAVGDKLAFGWTSSNNVFTGQAYRAITGISGGPINASVTVGANLGVASQAGRKVINITRNVRVIGSAGNTYQSQVTPQVWQSQAVADVVEFGYCEIGTGSVAFGINAASAGPAIRTTKAVSHVVSHSIWSISGSTVTPVSGNSTLMFFFSGQNYGTNVCDTPICVGNPSSANYALSMQNGAGWTVTNPAVVGVQCLFNASYSQGPIGSSITGGFLECAKYLTYVSNSINFPVSGMSVRGLSSLYYNAAAIAIPVTSVDFGSASPYLTNGTVNFIGDCFNVTLDGCTMDPSWVLSSSGTNLNVANASAYLRIRNKNNDVTLQDCYVQGGRQTRDNSQVYRGQSSLALYPWYSGVVNTFAFTVPVGASSSVRLKGYYRFNAAYLTATPPQVTVSGMGITPVVSTCTATADTWFPFDITVTNPQTYPGSFTVTLAGQSTAESTSAACWFDGLAITDYVTWTQHYGFTYDPSNPVRTVDPVVQLSESAAAALTGISYSTGTLTITGSRSIREVYDWLKQYEASNRIAPLITSADGVTFTLAANLTMGAGAALTGTGTLTIGSKTLTVGANATSTVNVTHSAGVWTLVSVTGMAAGTTLVVDDSTAATNLYTGTPGTSWSANIQWPNANHTIRVRARYAVGTAAKAPIDLTGTLTSTGLSVALSQVADPYYTLDGSTVTGVSFNGGAATVSVTAAQTLAKLYAAAVYWSSLTGNFSYSVPVSTADGTNYLSSYAWAIAASVAITGSGAISLGAAALSIGGGASSTVPWTYSSGAAAWVQVTASGIVAGSRVQVYDTTSGTELYNGVPGTSIAFNAVWTANHTLRLRVAYQSGAAAKLPVQAVGLLTSAGCAFLVAQVDDTVYNALAIDGSTVTELTADLPHVLIDLSSGAASITVQRIYAWTCFEQTTSGGIASMFNAVTAIDALNFIVNVGVVNAYLFNTTTTPCLVIGGTLRRSDGSTVIAAGSTGNIQMDPKLAYQAPTGVDVRMVNGVTIKGTGVSGDTWGPA